MTDKGCICFLSGADGYTWDCAEHAEYDDQSWRRVCKHEATYVFPLSDGLWRCVTCSKIVRTSELSFA